MKNVLAKMDAEGQAFVRCEVRLEDGSESPPFWLCDIVRVIEAIDEERSRLRIEFDPNNGEKIYDLLGGASLVFRQDALGNAHIWRCQHLETPVICDESLREACRDAGLKGIRFRDASKL